MAKILESPKLTDASESILYRSVRERFDSECAAEKDEYVRMTIEALADLVGDMVRGDTERCRLCLVGDKTLGGLYLAMQEKAKDLAFQRLQDQMRPIDYIDILSTLLMKGTLKQKKEFSRRRC